MDFFEQLRRHLSAKDFSRMEEWIAGLPPAQQMEMMEFILARDVRAPAVGDQAPDFELPHLGSAASVRLSRYRGVQPVALIFGSFT